MKKAIILFLAFFVLLSCGVKKKNLQKEKESIEIVTDTKTKAETSTETKTDSVVSSNKTEILIEKETELDIVADSSGVVTVETEITDKGVKKTFTGVKTVSVRDREAETKKVDSTALKWKKTVKDTASYYVKLLEKLKAEKKTVSDVKEVDNRNIFWMIAFFVLLGINILHFLYKNRKRFT